MDQMNRLPHDTTMLFCEVFESADVFVEEWNGCGLYEEDLVKNENISKLYYLLYSRYGNSAIANWDITQFKYKVFSIIYQYCPTWEKRKDVQKRLRELNENDIILGGKAIYNRAYNPSQEPSTSGLEEIPTINDQNTTNFKKSVMEGYAILLDLLETDVTQELIDRFKPLFAKFVYTRPDIFVTDKEED